MGAQGASPAATARAASSTTPTVGGSDPSSLQIPASARLFLRYPLTIEAWVQPYESQTQAIFSDYYQGDQPNTELSFELTGGGLVFYSNAGCADANQAAATTAAAIPVDTFTHVAATWDGAEVRFYVDGTLIEAVPFAHTPCENDTIRDWFIGRRGGGGNPFDGVIDELELSDYVKTEAQIRASMAYDPTASVGVCGDRAIESGVCARAGGRITDGLVARNYTAGANP